MPGQWLPEAGVAALARYIVADEEPLAFVMRRHWVILATPVGTVIGVGLLALFVSVWFPSTTGIIILVWFGVAIHAAFVIADWWVSWFGSSQRRLMLTYGLITRKVAMMPLEKVTDMSYNRSPAGQLFGYGSFVLESAGQDQALRVVNFVPNPDAVYRRLVATMFSAKKPTPTPTPDPPSAIGRRAVGNNDPTTVITPHGPEGGPRLH